ncbi:hypothetical protein GGR57DRAFT_301553 [Xylariaceae sp. FL1272]|nr:hypothetical protein GGR57DRAFT_301553 [Xylariaceae sp. FL1272]
MFKMGGPNRCKYCQYTCSSLGNGECTWMEKQHDNLSTQEKVTITVVSTLISTITTTTIETQIPPMTMKPPSPPPALQTPTAITTDTSTHVTSISTVIHPTNEPSSSPSSSVPLSPSITTAPALTVSLTAGSHAKPDSLSDPAVAGLSIGLVIIGLLLGLVIAFFVLRYYKKRDIPPIFISQSEKGEIVPLNARTDDSISLDHLLLDPVPQARIAHELQSLDQLIQKHCETYYHLLPVQSNETELSDNLHLVGIENRHPSGTGTAAALLLDSTTRLTTIRYIIANVLFGSTALVSSSGISLLPPGVSDIASRMPPPEENTGNQRATQAALTQWRQLSAFLLHPNRSDRTPLVPSDDHSAVQEHKLIIALNRCLEPFIKGGEDGIYEQESHLEQIVRACSTFGYLLFSQPSEYRLQFKNDEGAGLVVCPGLYKIINDTDSYYQELVSTPIVESMQR